MVFLSHRPIMQPAEARNFGRITRISRINLWGS